MNKICTSLEQSKKLLELGIDVKTADMLWTYDFTVNDINCLNVISKHLKPEENDIPAWSLVALLELIPSNVFLYAKLVKWDNSYYIENRSMLCDNPIDAAFEMVCWLKENGKL